MFRVLNLISLIALLAAAGAVYHVKYSSTFEAQRLARLRGDIRIERDRIAALKAEWARRTAPDRIQALAERHLDMQPVDVNHLDQLAGLPEKPQQAPDALGGMIEALVDGPLVTGSTGRSDKPATKPAAPAPAAGVPAAKAGHPPLPLDAVPSGGSLTKGWTGPGSGAVGPPLVSAPITAPAPLLPPAPVGDAAGGSR